MKPILNHLFAALLLGLPYLVSAQPGQIQNANGTLLCPGVAYNFASNNASSSSGCSVDWAITGGSTLLPNPTTAGLMQVSFNDVPGGSATLKTTYSNCSTTAANGVSRELVVYIRSVTNVPLGALTLNGSTTGSIEFGSTAPVTLEVPVLAIPRNSNEPNPVAVFAAGYEWTIPSGWTWPDGAISNGAPRLFNSRSVSSPNRIVVTPPATACAGGVAPVVRVQAVDTECSIGATAGYQPTRSAVRTLTVNCLVPQPVIISNRTPQGGPISLYCGEPLQAEQVRVGTANVPSGGAFSNYSFSTSGVVSSFCCLGSATPGLTVSGVGTGTISLSAIYTRNGASTTVAAVPVAVTVRPELAPVALRPFAAVCPGQVLRLEVNPVPGATSYAWTVPPPFGPSGVQVTPASQPFLDVVSPANALGRSYTVTVEARSGGCASSTAQQDGVLGAGSGLDIQSTANPGEVEICADQTFQVYAVVENPRTNTIDYNWTISVRSTSTSGSTFLSNYTDSGPVINVTTPSAGLWLDVQLSSTSSCGSLRPVSKSWQAVSQYRNGNYCLATSFRSAPTPAYPNPANERLRLPAGGTYTLYNVHGKLVRQVRTADGVPGEMDTRALPAGPYYLVRQDLAGHVTRQTLELKH